MLNVAWLPDRLAPVFLEIADNLPFSHLQSQEFTSEWCRWRKKKKKHLVNRSSAGRNAVLMRLREDNGQNVTSMVTVVWADRKAVVKDLACFFPFRISSFFSLPVSVSHCIFCAHCISSEADIEEEVEPSVASFYCSSPTLRFHMPRCFSAQYSCVITSVWLPVWFPFSLL